MPIDDTDRALTSGPEDPRVGWGDRIEFTDGPRGPVAYRPNQVITPRPAEAVAVLRNRWQDGGANWRRGEKLDPFDEELIGRIDDVPDPVAALHELRLAGINATLNTVFFAHCGGCCPAHPASYWGANPAFANPAFANPADEFLATGLRRSSVRPAELDDVRVKAFRDALKTAPVSGGPKVIVLDTGLAGTNPPAAMGVAAIKGNAVDGPDSDGNNRIDGAAGHGTFIAGIVKGIAPGSDVNVLQVLRSYGDGDEATIVDAINRIQGDERTILNLSFGGYVWDEPFALARAIRKFQNDGGVVVSSAGNDSGCQPSYPAALPDVVSVGAVGPTGPAAFTNYGPWVRACAPGVDVVSMFFEGFNGAELPQPGATDPDDFGGWARWSGTSFAAPTVAAALATIMLARPNVSAKAAVQRLIDAPGLLRLPNLGTVVNVVCQP